MRYLRHLAWRFGKGGWRCWFRHDWQTKQYGLRLEDGLSDRTAVLCWRQCRRCAASKLVHILE